MNISLLRIPAGGRAFAHQYAPDELDVSAHAFTLNEPPHISGHVKESARDFHVTGELKATVSSACHRCLRDLFMAVNESFKLVYAPVDEARGPEGEREINEQELEFAYLEGDELDLDQLIREQLELALPSRILCRSDCQGLCAQCGADLNEAACPCAASVEPRWQALAELQEKNH